MKSRVETGGPIELRQDTRGERARKGATLLVLIAAVSGLHYLTDPHYGVLHGIYQRLYYVPVILGAYWYGVRGGLLAAGVAALAYIPHIHLAWSGNPAYSASQYAEVVMFVAAGVFIGVLAEHERRLTAQYRRAAASLERANRELRESQEQVRRADRLSALGEMAAGLAHELRNPLAGVKGAFEIVTSKLPAGTPEAEFAEIGARELARLDDLLKRFLSYARPQPPALRRARLDDILAHVVALLRPEAERAGVQVDLEPRGQPPELLVDVEQIEQVFLNVLLNAIQASPGGGRVTIRQGLDGTGAIVDVVDEGPGIPPEHRTRVFDPFFTTKEKGTGLGLAVSARIVAAHGGDIEARPGPGRGTCMRIRLPLPAGSPQVSAGGSASGTRAQS